MGVVISLLVLWTLYPIVFALAEGTGKISPNKEVSILALPNLCCLPCVNTGTCQFCVNSAHSLVNSLYLIAVELLGLLTFASQWFFAITQVVFYGILDILAKVVFGAVIVSAAPHQ